MPSTSERATASIRDMREEERPLAEQFRVVAKQHADADAEWYFMAEFKSAMLEQMKSNLIAEQGDMPDNKAERIVKSGMEWEAWIRKMADAKKRANLLKSQCDYIRMLERKEDRDHWSSRSEKKMLRGTT